MTYGQRISESGKSASRPGERPGPVEGTLQEELLARYWWGVSVSTGALLEASVAMLFLTYKTTRGFLSLEDYCRRELEWRHSEYEGTFTSEERAALRADPIERSYDPQLNAKILTKVWTSLGSDVVARVKELQRLVGEASHDPPRVMSKRQLRLLLHRVFRKQQDIRDKILRFCQTSIERELEILIRRKWELKQSLEKVYKKLSDYKMLLSLIPLERAIFMMTTTQHLLAIHTDQVPDVAGLAMAPDLRRVPRAVMELERLSQQLAVTREQMTKINASVRSLGGTYVSLFLRHELVHMAKVLVEAGGEGVNDGDLDLYVSKLRREKSDCVGRLRVIGKSEVLGFQEIAAKQSYSVHLWLLSRTLCKLNVEKVYSVMELEDRSILSVEELLNGKWPSIIITGPIGSGKTCLSQFIFRHWRDGGSAIASLSEVDLVVPLASEHASGRSFVHHIRVSMFPEGLRGAQDDHVYASLRQLKVLFVLDLKFVTEGVAQATRELSAGLGGNRMIIMARPEVAVILRQFLRNVDVKMAHIHPLEGPLLENLCEDFLRCRTVEGPPPPFAFGEPGRNGDHARQNNNALSGVEKGTCNRSNINMQVKHFIETLMSEKRDEELMFPLPIAYMIFLWEEERSRLKKVTSVSRLFQTLMSWCKSRLRLEIQESRAASGRDVQRTVKKVMESAYHIASETFAAEARLHQPTMECFQALSPLLACVTASQRCHTGQKHAHLLLHGALAEFIYAYSIVDKFPKERHIIPKCFYRPKLPQILPVSLVENTGGKYVSVIQHVFSLLCQRGLPHADAREMKQLAELYLNSGVSNDDYIAWACLLRRGGWQGPMKKVVSQVFKPNTTWKACESGRQTHALCALVTHGVHLPQHADVTGRMDPEVMAVLRARPEISVRVLPPRDFRGMRSLEPSDVLVCELQDAGNLVEFWGRLNENGAAALASMSRLYCLHLCLASLPALNAFSRSLGECVNLHQLHLHLELPQTVAPDRLRSLACPTSLKAHLRLYDVSDLSWEWVVRVVKRLGGPFQDVTLLRTRLSPPVLQRLKEKLLPTHVHVCEANAAE